MCVKPLLVFFIVKKLQYVFMKCIISPLGKLYLRKHKYILIMGFNLRH